MYHDPPPPRSLRGAMVLQYGMGGALLPFLTLLLRDRGLSLPQISLILASASAALLVSPFLWGMLADRFLPLNRLFLIVNVLAAAALLGFARQTSVTGLLVTFTLFFACYQPAPTLVNALCLRHLADPIEQFAPIRAWGSFGWVLPSLPISVWLALKPKADFEFILGLTLAFALAMAALSFALPHTPPGAARRVGEDPLRLGYGAAIARLLRNPGYLVVLGSYFLVSASFAIQAYYSPPRLEDLGMARAWMGPAQSIGVIWEIVLFRWRSVLVNRLGYSGSVLIGCAALVVRQLLFACSDNLWVLAASYLLVGTTVVLYHIGVSLLVEAIAGPEVKATAQTLLVLCSSGLGPVFANAAVGRLAAGTHPNLSGVFVFAAGLALLATLLILARGRRLAPVEGPDRSRRPRSAAGRVKRMVDDGGDGVGRNRFQDDVPDSQPPG
jgi:MFS family permease